MTVTKLFEQLGVWVWVQPKTKEDGSVCWIANGRHVPTKRHDNGCEIDPIHYKECSNQLDAYNYAFDYLLNKK